MAEWLCRRVKKEGARIAMNTMLNGDFFGVKGETLLYLPTYNRACTCTLVLVCFVVNRII